MSESLSSQVATDLAPVDVAIEQEATRLAGVRSKRIADFSGGAVQATVEQHAAIKVNAVAELQAAIREQLRDVMNVYVVSLSQSKEV